MFLEFNNCLIRISEIYRITTTNSNEFTNCSIYIFLYPINEFHPDPLIENFYNQQLMQKRFDEIKKLLKIENIEQKYE